MDNELKEIKKVRVGRISYINVAPVYYGLDRGLKPDWLELVTAPPVELNTRLESGEIDISPVSSAAYAMNHDKWYLMPDLSISCFGEVMSVLLVSHEPIDKLDKKKILLSEESASAASLVRYIFNKKDIQPEFISSQVLKPADIDESASAALVIGDAALTEGWGSYFNHIYDLGEIWKGLTGLPFVFAVWAVRKEFADKYPNLLKEISDFFVKSKQNGKENQNDIIERAVDKTGLNYDDCETYFELLNCDLNMEHRKGLKCFFDELYNCGIINKKIEPEFAGVFR